MEPTSAFAGSAMGDFRDDMKWGAETFLSMRENRTARAYNTKMASTQFQRTMEDMRRAGLNPALVGKFGGAPMPPAQSAVIPQGGRGSSALEGMMAASSMEVQQAQARSLNATAAKEEVAARVSARTESAQIDMAMETLYKLRGDADISHATRARIDDEIAKLRAEKKLIDVQHQHSAYDLDRSRQESKFYKGVGGQVAPWLDKILRRLR